MTMTTTTEITEIQVMPDLTPDEYDALKDDIASRGIQYPVIKDQHGRILDGYHRTKIAEELGIEIPTEVHTIADGEDAREIGLSLNMARRHLTREQKHELIRREHEYERRLSDREIGRRIGVSHHTVAAVLRPAEVGKTPTQDQPRRTDTNGSRPAAVEDEVLEGNVLDAPDDCDEYKTREARLRLAKSTSAMLLTKVRALVEDLRHRSESVAAELAWLSDAQPDLTALVDTIESSCNLFDGPLRHLVAIADTVEKAVAKEVRKAER